MPHLELGDGPQRALINPWIIFLPHAESCKRSPCALEGTDKGEGGPPKVLGVLFMDRVLTEYVILWYALTIVMGDNGVSHRRKWTMRSSGQVDQRSFFF